MFDHATDVVATLAMTTVMANPAIKIALSFVTQQLEEAANKKIEMRAALGYALTGTTIAMSFGFLGWAFKTGALLASLLSVLPVWARFDPLPVLNLSPEQRDELKLSIEKAAEEERLKYESMVILLDKDNPDTPVQERS